MAAAKLLPRLLLLLCFPQRICCSLSPPPYVNSVIIHEKCKRIVNSFFVYNIVLLDMQFCRELLTKRVIDNIPVRARRCPVKYSSNWPRLNLSLWLADSNPAWRMMLRAFKKCPIRLTNQLKQIATMSWYETLIEMRSYHRYWEKLTAKAAYLIDLLLPQQHVIEY